MAQHRQGSISAPIIYGSISVALTVALLIGWIYVILKNQELTQQWVANLWLLIAGIVSFAMILTVLVLFSVFLARQVLEIRRQSTFVDSVTHELRSPLASIRLGLETLGRNGLDRKQRENLREMMLDDVERLSAFVDDILEATRIEHGNRASTSSHVELAAVLERCVAAVTRRHKVPRDVVTLDVPDAMVLATDETALEVVVKNLLDNAIKYSEDDPRVELRVHQTPAAVQIDVTDHGVGIPHHELRRVFERFYRVDSEEVRARRGTGLGLFVVKALVARIGGKLSAHSEGLGHGTTMTVRLRASKVTPAPAPERAELDAIG